MISNHVTILKTLKTAYQIIYMLRPIPIKDLRLIYFWSKYEKNGRPLANRYYNFTLKSLLNFLFD